MMVIFISVLLCMLAYNADALSCGVTAIPPNMRVVGGYDTERKAWPWVVSLSHGSPIGTANNSRGGHICGGILLHSQWVLTAAHCLDKPDKRNVFPNSPPKSWRVIAGMHTRSSEEEKQGNWQSSPVKRFIYYKGFEDNIISAKHDIALIQLSKPFAYSDYVRPICLPKAQSIQPGWNRCFTAGWGTKAENSTHFSLTLNEVPILIVNKWYCYAKYMNMYMPGHQICGGDWHSGNKDSCKGDSGGPLACQQSNGAWYVAGIVSWGIGCGRKYTPGVYTDVQAYENWIRQVVRKFTVLPKLSRPKAYTSKRNRKRRSLGNHAAADDDFLLITSPYHMTSSQRKNMFSDSIHRYKRQVKTSPTLSDSKSFFKRFISFVNLRKSNVP